jgi:hypothetical protein
VAVSKRDYHQNHYVLAKILIDRFGIPVEKEHPISPSYAEDVLGTDTTFRVFNERIIILGFILDGDISSRERKRFNQLKTAGLIRAGKEELVSIKDSFVYGKGIDVKTN